MMLFMPWFFIIDSGRRLASTAAERYLLLYMIAVLIIVTSLVIAFFVMFIIRKNKLFRERMLQKQAIQEEITHAQTETQEQTLKNIGMELHDNVGQSLTFASMQLSVLKRNGSAQIQAEISELAETVKLSLSELRSLAKTLNNEVISDMGFIKALVNEIERLRRMRFDTAELEIIGEPGEIENKKNEIVLFRIIQEFLSNSVKYSKAKNILITLEFLPELLIITAKDDGQGFDEKTIKKGSGIINMQSRAHLIKAELKLESQLNEGVRLEIRYPN
ncbi:sensor histidine kinase [Tamlana sp. I1]|uniref:sensor histidine kinase n=1 Tax=Tamlana sp. I1 TaxID=2762061 RepID=UPI001E36E2E4|nr:histidine kinase [Tamlana sp. I1]